MWPSCQSNSAFKFVKSEWEREMITKTITLETFIEQVHRIYIEVVGKGLKPRYRVRTDRIAYSWDFINNKCI